jgi:hypothetical protein
MSMKKIAFLLGLACYCLPIHAQKINLPAESVKTLLCKKWEVSYVLNGTMRIDMPPGVPVMNYEFKKDNTFLLSDSKSNEVHKGTWVYDPTKKTITMIVIGGATTAVTKLNETELRITADMTAATPSDPTAITMICKIKG